jgi:2-polyprenyl-6-methoxyphenol hydroxylase-like FAD-dependent oxidoreductase
MTSTVLVSGAGVAGLAVAYWLRRLGLAPTVVERFPAQSGGGQAVDIRGVALDVLGAMGLGDKVRDKRTRLKGMSVVDANGIEVRRVTDRTYSAGRLDSGDVEIFRSDLCALLADAASGIDIVHDDGIRALDVHADGVDVEFLGGAPRRFDIVIGADGVYSHTRRLAFADESCVKPLGVALALYTTANLIDLRDIELAHRQETLGVVVYPTLDASELRVGVGFESGDVDRHDVAGQKALIASRCAGVGGDLAKLVAAVETTPQFYYGDLAQVKLPSWSNGRVVLAGDAAHCASPFSGQGTSLALVGALVLAQAIARHRDDVPAAFSAYEERMRPFVALNQDLVDLTRQGPTPDEEMTRAKNGIEIGDLIPA